MTASFPAAGSGLSPSSSTIKHAVREGGSAKVGKSKVSPGERNAFEQRRAKIRVAQNRFTKIHVNKIVPAKSRFAQIRAAKRGSRDFGASEKGSRKRKARQIARHARAKETDAERLIIVVSGFALRDGRSGFAIGPAQLVESFTGSLVVQAYGHSARPLQKQMRGDRIAICRRPGNRMSPLSRATWARPVGCIRATSCYGRLAATDWQPPPFNASMLHAVPTHED